MYGSFVFCVHQLKLVMMYRRISKTLFMNLFQLRYKVILNIEEIQFRESPYIFTQTEIFSQTLNFAGLKLIDSTDSKPKQN